MTLYWEDVVELEKDRKRRWGRVEMKATLFVSLRETVA